MTEDTGTPESRGPTREPEPPDMSPKTVTGYHIDTDTSGTTDITLTLRQGGTVPLHGLTPAQALLYLELLRRPEGSVLAVWVPETGCLQWRV